MLAHVYLGHFPDGGILRDKGGRDDFVPVEQIFKISNYNYIKVN